MRQLGFGFDRHELPPYRASWRAGAVTVIVQVGARSIDESWPPFQAIEIAQIRRENDFLGRPRVILAGRDYKAKPIHGHPFEGENLVMRLRRRPPHGWVGYERCCRTCEAIWNKAAKERQKARPVRKEKR